jgi:integrase
MVSGAQLVPKMAKPLTSREVATRPRGMYADGHGLYLAVGDSSRSWIFRYKLGDRRREMGLGAYPIVALQAARDAAIDLQRLIRTGIDPIDQKRTEGHRRELSAMKAISFAEAASAFIGANEHKWRDSKSWHSSFDSLANPIIGNLPVALIDTPAIMSVLKPIWLTKAVSAKRLRSRIENVLDWAVAGGYRKEGPNPAKWKGNLELLLGRQQIEAKGHPAVPYAEIPLLMATLRARGSIVAKALRFVVLTAARAGEVTGATWAEIDLESRQWTVPKSRMKGKREHIVPLSDAALAVLRDVSNYREPDGHIFSGERVPVMTTAAMVNLLAKVAPGYDTHGLRSSFSTWAAETRLDRDLVETALAHTVERAYNRSDLVELRRPLMEKWARHCGR